MNEISVKMDFNDDFREKYILSMNNLIFPVSKVDNTYISYASGYIKLKDIDKTDEYSAILILEKVLIIMENMKDYLFKPNEYLINENTIFLKIHNDKIIDVRLLFIKKESNLNDTLTMLNLAYSVFNKTNDNGKSYYKKVINEIRNCNLDYIKLLELLNDIKTEILSFSKY